MKAPDKIYVPILPRTENSRISEHCVGTAWDNKEHITIPNVEEYIRKNALLEWAKEKYSEYKQMDEDFQGDVFLGNRHALAEVIQKIESL